jgi:hypothetical protein
VSRPGIAIEGPEVSDEVRAEWVQVEIADQFQEVGVLFHDDGLVPVLEQVSHPLVAAVKGAGVAGEQGAHAPSQRPRFGAE